MNDCKHKHWKRIITHGRKSPKLLVCKFCDKVISKHEIKKIRDREKHYDKKLSEL